MNVFQRDLLLLHFLYSIGRRYWKVAARVFLDQGNVLIRRSLRPGATEPSVLDASKESRRMTWFGGPKTWSSTSAALYVRSASGRSRQAMSFIMWARTNSFVKKTTTSDTSRRSPTRVSKGELVVYQYANSYLILIDLIFDVTLLHRHRVGHERARLWPRGGLWRSAGDETPRPAHHDQSQTARSAQGHVRCHPKAVAEHTRKNSPGNRPQHEGYPSVVSKSQVKGATHQATELRCPELASSRRQPLSSALTAAQKQFSRGKSRRASGGEQCSHELSATRFVLRVFLLLSTIDVQKLPRFCEYFLSLKESFNF